MATEAQTPEIDEDAPLLEISTLTPKRPTVSIDEEPYELRVPSELGIIEQQELRSEGAEFAKLWNKDELSAGGKKKLKKLLDTMFDRVLDAPAEVKDRLNDEQRQEIVVAFTVAPMRKATALIAEMDQETREGSTSAS